MPMIPLFPDYTTLKPAHQKTIEKIVRDQLPYSDFNFVSMWSWDYQTKLQISMLNGNLVVRFQDYLDPQDSFYSFFGTNRVDETIDILLDHSLLTGAELRLVPQCAIKNIVNKKKYVIQEDHSSFDYMIDVQKNLAMEGNVYRSNRREINAFMRAHGDNIEVRSLQLDDAAAINDIVTMFKEWHRQSKQSTEFKRNEFRAVRRLLSNRKRINLQNIRTLGVYIDQKMAAFAIAEVLAHGYAMGHFKKSSRDYLYIGEALDHFMLDHLRLEGVKQVNYEQDLGIIGLRQSKMSSHPVDFLKKYSVSYKKPA